MEKQVTVVQELGSKCQLQNPVVAAGILVSSVQLHFRGKITYRYYTRKIE